MVQQQQTKIMGKKKNFYNDFGYVEPIFTDYPDSPPNDEVQQPVFIDDKINYGYTFNQPDSPPNDEVQPVFIDDKVRPYIFDQPDYPAPTDYPTVSGHYLQLNIFV